MKDKKICEYCEREILENQDYINDSCILYNLPPIYYHEECYKELKEKTGQ